MLRYLRNISVKNRAPTNVIAVNGGFGKCARVKRTVLARTAARAPRSDSSRKKKNDCSRNCWLSAQITYGQTFWNFGQSGFAGTGCPVSKVLAGIAAATRHPIPRIHAVPRGSGQTNPNSCRGCLRKLNHKTLATTAAMRTLCQKLRGVQSTVSNSPKTTNVSAPIARDPPRTPEETPPRVPSTEPTAAFCGKVFDPTAISAIL